MTKVFRVTVSAPLQRRRPLPLSQHVPLRKALVLGYARRHASNAGQYSCVHRYNPFFLGFCDRFGAVPSELTAPSPRHITRS
jgi:hypothetical protein